MRYLAKTFAGLENVLAAELKELGAQNIEIIKRGATFEGDLAMLYRTNLGLRTALRILVPVRAFRATNDQTLYEQVKSIDWQRFITLRQTFAVDAVVHSTIFTHSQFVALKVKDAIADRFRADNRDRRPFVNSERPDLLVNVHINEDQVTISLDSSGKSLHQRGWREEQTTAPLNEVLTAGILRLTGWNGDVPLVDAMCGSATLPIEAALLATNTPPQYRREYFCFKSWKNFDESLFKAIENEFAAKKQHLHVPILGSDINKSAIEIAEKNIQSARLKNRIKIEYANFFERMGADVIEDYEIAQERAAAAFAEESIKTDEKPVIKPPKSAQFENIEGILIMNPPYDERLSIEDAKGFHQKIGDHLKNHWKGWQVWIFTGNLEAAKFIGLRPTARIPLFNGSIECRLLKFDIF
jgi:putative N6-adenine-specific DNA methylase